MISLAHYPENTVYICESAQTSVQNPIANRHRVLILGIVVEKETGIIVDAEINSICGITTRFVHDMLVGRSLSKDLDLLVDSFEKRYHGSSRKGLIVCLNAAAQRFESL